jgi:site-specific DNA recombinase
LSAPKVLGYVRVSTIKQADKGLSLSAQRLKVTAFAELHKLDLVEIIEDGGKSGESLDRPGIQEVLRRLDASEVAGVVVAKLDRITRDVLDWASLVKQRFGSVRGPTLHSASEYIDLRTPNGRFFGNLIVCFSQCELETGVERTESVMGDKRSRGERLGTIPFGFALAADKKTLMPCPVEANALTFMAGLRAKGLKLRDIADELDTYGFRPRSGGKWALSTLSQLLEEAPCEPTS